MLCHERQKRATKILNRDITLEIPWLEYVNLKKMQKNYILWFGVRTGDLVLLKTITHTARLRSSKCVSRSVSMELNNDFSIPSRFYEKL